MVWNPFTSTKNPRDQAAGELYAKSSKLTTALDAVMVDDWRKLAATERAVVNRYRDGQMFKGTPTQQSGSEDGELIVADDVQINQGATWQTLTAVAIPTALCIVTWMLTKDGQPPRPDVEVEVGEPVKTTDLDTRYEFKTLPGE